MEVDNNYPIACSSGAKVLGENTNLDPDTARRIFEVGANLFMLDVPINTEIGVDMNSWNTGPNFKGIKIQTRLKNILKSYSCKA